LAPPFETSSGDLRADRRLIYAQALAREGDHAGAASLIEQALELAPGWAAGWFALGESLEASARGADAEAAFVRALELQPGDPFGAGLRLARLAGAAPDAAPPAYIRGLFDDYADRFETALTERLDYRAPALLRKALDPLLPAGEQLRVLDLGCGTGLAGDAFADLSSRLVGLDLSPAMLAKAGRKGIYQALHEAEAVRFLEAAEERFDLVLAADVLVYLGVLGPVFSGARRVLAPGGLLAFTVEALESEGFALGACLRYRHSRPYIEGQLAAARLDSRLIEPATLRLEGGEPVAGLVCVARRAA